MTSKQSGLLAGIAAALALVLAGCGADPTATPTSVPTATPPPQAAATPTPDEAALFQAEWDALIAAAQEEGELTMVFGGSAGRNFRPIAQAFGERFGIEVTVATGGGTAGAQRIMAEQSTGRYLVDLMFGGSGVAITTMAPAGALAPIGELFIHPEVTDLSLWYNGRHWYTDAEQKFVFAFAATARPENLGMRYNTDLVTQDDIDAMNSVFDYLDPKWKGKIVSRSPLHGDVAFFTQYVHPDIGTEWIDRFVSPDLDVTFSDDNRFMVDGVAKGKFALGISIGGAGRDLDSLGTLGAPVKALVKEFKEGGGLSASASSDVFHAPINPPHPNATKLWVNWWLTKEGQTIMHTMATELPDPTLRVDVTDWGKTDEKARRVEGKTYLFFDAQPELIAKNKEAFDYGVSAFEAARR